MMTIQYVMITAVLFQFPVHYKSCLSCMDLGNHIIMLCLKQDNTLELLVVCIIIHFFHKYQKKIIRGIT